MAEKVFSILGKDITITRTIKLLRQAWIFQKKMGEETKAPQTDFYEDDFDPDKVYEAQERMLDLRIAELSRYFGIDEKAFEEVDPKDVIEVSDNIYKFLSLNVDDEKGGETPGEN